MPAVRGSLVKKLMKGEIAERWRTLCQQAQTEKDPDKLMEIVHEINRLLEEKEQRLRNQGPKDQNNTV